MVDSEEVPEVALEEAPEEVPEDSVVQEVEGKVSVAWHGYAMTQIIHDIER